MDEIPFDGDDRGGGKDQIVDKHFFDGEHLVSGALAPDSAFLPPTTLFCLLSFGLVQVSSTTSICLI